MTCKLRGEKWHPRDQESHFKKLVTLKLTGNQLCGIPKSIALFSSLQYLIVGHNRYLSPLD